MNGPIEPPAEIRQSAAAIRLTFLALRQEGFNEKQALVIVGQILLANAERDR